VIKREPQAQSRVKQEQLDDSVVGHVKQEPLDDPVAEDDLRAQWEADLDVKEEEDDDDPGEEQYPEDDADDDEEDEEEEDEGDDVTEAQSGIEGYGTAEEDADLVTARQDRRVASRCLSLTVPSRSANRPLPQGHGAVLP